VHPSSWHQAGAPLAHTTRLLLSGTPGRATFGKTQPLTRGRHHSRSWRAWHGGAVTPKQTRHFGDGRACYFWSAKPVGDNHSRSADVIPCGLGCSQVRIYPPTTQKDGAPPAGGTRQVDWKAAWQYGCLPRLTMRPTVDERQGTLKSMAQPEAAPVRGRYGSA
jgi:hypothetical protein